MEFNDDTISSISDEHHPKCRNKDNNSLLRLFIDYVLPLQGQNHSSTDVNRCVDWLTSANSSCSEGTDFQIAVKNKLAPILKMLLEAKNNVNFTNRLEESVLRVFLSKYAKDSANASKDRALIEALINKGASVDVVDSIGYTPLQYAATISRPDLLRLMLDNSDDLNLRNYLGHTVLHLLLYNYEQHPSEIHLEATRDLLIRGADVRAKNKKGLTPVHLAIQNGLVKVLLVFVEHGIDVEHYIGGDSNLLLHLCKNVVNWTRSSDELQAIHRLVNLAEDVRSRSRKFYLTPLHFVSQVDRPDAIELLLRAGADIDARSVDGLTPLHLAALQGSLTTMEHLIQRGADVNAREEMIGFGLMHMALLSCDRDKVRSLIDNGFDVNVKSKHGLAPFHLAVIMADNRMLRCLIERYIDFRGTIRRLGMMRLNSVEADCMDAKILIGADENVAEMSLISQYVKCLNAPIEYLEEMMMLLHEVGANVNAKDSTLKSPLHYAAMQKAGKLETLLNLGAHLDVRDVDGKLPLQSVLDRGNSNGLDQLMRYGANLDDVLVGNFYEWSVDVRNRLYDHANQLEAADLPIRDDCRQRLLLHVNRAGRTFYQWDYREEVKKLKCYYINDSKISLHDFLRMSSRRRLTFAQTVLSIDLDVEFPIYRNIVEACARESVYRNSLMRQAGAALCELADVNLPEICTDHIFAFLDNRHLIVVIDSCDVDVDDT